MPLHAEDMLIYLIHGVRAVVAGGEQPGAVRQVQHLVLVGDNQPVLVQRRLHEGSMVQHLRPVDANAPASRRLGGPPPQALGHQLMAEANPQGLLLHRVQVLHKGAEAGYPGVIVIDALPRAGNHIGVALVQRRRILAMLDIVGAAGQRLAPARRRRRKEPLKHARIVAMLGTKVRHDGIGLQDAKGQASHQRGVLICCTIACTSGGGGGVKRLTTRETAKLNTIPRAPMPSGETPNHQWAAWLASGLTNLKYTM